MANISKIKLNGTNYIIKDSVIRSKFDHLHIVNALDIGLKNDSSVDISTILNGYTFAQGDVLFFPKGEYLLSDDVTLNMAGIIGCDATIDISVANKGFKIVANNTFISNLAFKGTVQNRGVAITINTVKDCVIDHCKFNDLESGVNLYCSERCTVRASYFDHCNIGVLSTGDDALSAVSNSIHNNVFNECLTYNGVLSRYSYYDEISANVFTTCGGFSASCQESVQSSIHDNISINSVKEAYNLQDCTSCEMSNNEARWFGDVGSDFGMSIWGTELVASRTGGTSKENVIKNNIVCSSHKSGIAIAGKCFGETIADNVLIGCSYDNIDAGSQAAIGLGSYGGSEAPYGCVVKGNTIYGNGITRYGIKEQGTPNPSTNYYYYNNENGVTSGNMFSLAGGPVDKQFNVPNT